VSILVAVGLVSIASAGDSGRFARQLVWVLSGAVLVGLVVVIGVENLLKHAYLLYTAGLGALILVLFTRAVNNTHAWFDFGLFKVQPSELFRPILLLVLAKFLGERMEGEFALRPGRLRRENTKYLFAGTLVLIPTILIFLEPDIGVAIALLLMATVIFFAAGISWQVTGLGVGTGIAGIAAVYNWGLSVTQQGRIAAWLNPADYDKGAAWQMIRSRLAIGSGGFWGKGWGQGEMNRLGLVPVNDSDFILSVVSEELGFVTVVVLVACYVWILWECVVVARNSKDAKGMLVAVGAGGYLAAQAALNIGVAVGLLPTTGVTLPFVSYGGSSMVSNMVMVAMVLAVTLGGRKSSLEASGRIPSF
jgi:rod shape determining protein RodA